MRTNKQTSRGSVGKPGIDPLTAVGIAVGGFVAGIFAERTLGITGKVEAKADKASKQIDAKVAAASQQVKAKTQQIEGKVKETKAKVKEAIEGKTEPEWNQVNDGYMTRFIGGRFYEIQYDAEGASVWQDNQRLSGPDENENWTTVNAAKKYVERITKSRNNSGLSAAAKKYRDDVVETFHSHARVSPNAVKSGSVALYGVVFEDKEAYENGESDPLTPPMPIDSPDLWDSTFPGCVIEVVAMDPENKDAELSDSDIVPVEIVGMKSADLFFAEQGEVKAHEEMEYGKAERSHRANAPKAAPKAAPKSRGKGK